MSRRYRPPIARLSAVGVLTLLLCLGVGFLYAGWPPFVGEPGFSLSGFGYVAMATALVAVALLGLGLALLIFHDKPRE